MLSVALTWSAIPHWRRLERQLIFCALHFARERAGSSIAARIAIIAMTTSNSINVNAKRDLTLDGSVGFKLAIEWIGCAFGLAEPCSDFCVRLVVGAGKGKTYYAILIHKSVTV